LTEKVLALNSKKSKDKHKKGEKKRSLELSSSSREIIRVYLEARIFNSSILTPLSGPAA